MVGTRTNPRFEDGLQDRHRPLECSVYRCIYPNGEGDHCLPDVLLIKKRAFVRFARPSMFRVPMKDVFMVLTALNW